MAATSLTGSSSRRRSDPLHGVLVPDFLLHHVACFCRQRCRLHHCCLLYQQYPGQARTSQDAHRRGNNSTLRIRCPCVHSAVPPSRPIVTSPYCIYQGISKRRPTLTLARFFVLGYGAAVNLALNNVYCANTHPPSVILGLAHGSYGIGGIVAPIIGTAIVSQGVLWSRFYFLAVGLRVCCISFAAWAFWSYKEDAEHGLLTTANRALATTTTTTTTDDATSRYKDLQLALKNRVTIFGALFIFAYQGAEVSISGWIISYLIKYRNGDPAKVGYVTAGFWVRPFFNCALHSVSMTFQ